MASRAVAFLVAELDSLPYKGRERLLAARARGMGAAELGVLLGELAGGDRFARGCALSMALAARHAGTVRRLLDDPDPAIARRALAATLRGVSGLRLDAGEVLRIVLDAPAATRNVVYRALRAPASTPIADAVLEPVRARYGDREAARVLIGCSGAVVAARLAELEHAVGPAGRLGARHPHVVLDHVERQLAAAPAEFRDDVWRRLSAAVFGASEAAPGRVLDLLEAYSPTDRLPGGGAEHVFVAAYSPERFARLLGAPARAAWVAGYRAAARTRRRVVALPGPLAAPVLRAVRGYEPALAGWLRAAAPSGRAVLFEAAYDGVDRALHQPGEALLDALPWSVRASEARRVLALAAVRDDEAATLRYRAYLPWAEAAGAMVAATRRATADERAAGYQALVACAGRAREMGAAVDVLAERLRNEQEPVRVVAVRALATVAPGRFPVAAVEGLAAVVADAVDARDSSWSVRHGLATLVTRLLGAHAEMPEWRAFALAALDRMFGDRTPALGRLDRTLRRGQEHEVFASVRPWIAAAVARGAYDGLFAVARALGRRAHGVPGLQEMLGAATAPGVAEPDRRRAIALWLEPPGTRDERVGVLVGADPSAITLDEVWLVVSASRTDLVDVALGVEPVRGVFVTAGPRWVPYRAPNVSRWLPRQHARYAALLAGIIADPGHRTQSRVAAIAVAATIPEVGWEVVRPWVDDLDVPLAEAALGALAHTDRPADALPVLLAHAGDDRARVAMYAAGRAIRFVPPGGLASLLVEFAVGDGAKVTARKEAVRLIGSVGLAAPGELLASVWRSATHRDVRAAVVSAARQRLDGPACWEILEEAAGGGREDARAVLAGSPYLVPEPERPRYAGLVARALDADDRPTAVLAWGAAVAWGRWLPPVSAAAVARLVDLEDRAVWSAVANAVVRLAYDGVAPTVLRDAVAALAGADAAGADVLGADLAGADPARAESDRDRPARQRLTVLMNAAATWAAAPDRAGYRAALADAAAALGGYPDLSRHAAHLAVMAVDPVPAGAAALASALGEVATGLVGRPVIASRAARGAAGRVDPRKGADPDVVRAAAALLAADGRAEHGLFAVALATTGQSYGWADGWRHLVEILRRHPDADVRDAAYDLLLAPE